MASVVRELRDLRPAGVVAPGCTNCPVMDRCGGLQSGLPLFTCFDLNCCGKADCDNVCLRHPSYQERLRDIQGFGSSGLGPLHQRPMTLPRYVPMIHHGNKRDQPLCCEVAAIDPYQIMRVKESRYRAIVSDPAELRRKFKLADDTKIILRGTAKDKPLERYWQYRRRDKVMDALLPLKVSLFIGPNFSQFLDVPRTDNLYNRKRQLLCLSELSAAGISVAPHLSATMPADWKFWSDYLSDNSEVDHVAFNFQTGYRNFKQGMIALRAIESMQQSLGRPLSLVLIGGAQYLGEASSIFDRTTLIDSAPFVKTVKRQRMVETPTGKRSWQRSRTAIGQPLDDLFVDNITQYTDWVNFQTVTGLN
ncbi:hypothetical protein TBK1r_45980 [Stieleria magnilauensis]|uniref:DUF4417 domain-containing protein n=1 Tax=Stieleria magnilauensis TaxID=2527963 RepID=A0ABX5Y0J7_9BACT|nr:hypothetical protein TBK1r_45980 [Planctomycetes bacterium TBK1r]